MNIFIWLCKFSGASKNQILLEQLSVGQLKQLVEFAIDMTPHISDCVYILEGYELYDMPFDSFGRLGLESVLFSKINLDWDSDYFWNVSNK